MMDRLNFHAHLETIAMVDHRYFLRTLFVEIETEVQRLAFAFATIGSSVSNPPCAV
jgi:hypothetical protein